MKKLNVGMIGAGFIGQLAHLMNFVEVPNCRVVALAEPKPDLREKVTGRFGIPKKYATHTELLKDPEIDAVVVVLPRSLTGPVVLDCLRAGKHVLSEKPMAGSAKQGKILLDAANASNLGYAVGYMKRFDEGVEIAKQALDKARSTKELGSLMSIHATCNMGNSYCNAFGHVITQENVPSEVPGWTVAPEWLPEQFHAPYGAYLNTYSHVTNLLKFLLNESPSVEYARVTGLHGQLVVLKFQDCLATLQTGKMSHYGWNEEVRITFTDGQINLNLPPALLRNVPASVEIYKAGKTQERTFPCVGWSWAFRRQAENFVQDLLENRPMRNSAEEAYQDLLLTEEIWKKELQRLQI